MTVIRGRSDTLVAAILDAIYDDPEPIPWADLVHAFTTTNIDRRTVENILYDLDAHGSIQRIGRPGTRHRADDRAVRQTTLGRAWLDQELLPIPERTHP